MKAWELLEKSGWCKGALSRNAYGHEIHGDSKDAVAVAYCAVGAIAECYVDGKEYWSALTKLRAQIDCEASDWNDKPERTKQEVIDALKRADV